MTDCLPHLPPKNESINIHHLIACGDELLKACSKKISILRLQ